MPQISVSRMLLQTLCVGFLLATTAPTQVFADAMDGRLIEAFFDAEEDSAKQQRLAMRPLFMSGATDALDEQQWKSVVFGMHVDQLPARFSRPDTKVQRFDADEGSGAEVFEYYFTDKVVAQVLISTDQKVLDKRLE